MTLDVTTMPAHAHDLVSNTAVGTSGTAGNNIFAVTATGSKGDGGAGIRRYGIEPANTDLPPRSLSNTGQSQRHNNMQPLIAIGCSICLVGAYAPEAPTPR